MARPPSPVLSPPPPPPLARGQQPTFILMDSALHSSAFKLSKGRSSWRGPSWGRGGGGGGGGAGGG